MGLHRKKNLDFHYVSCTKAIILWNFDVRIFSSLILQCILDKYHKGGYYFKVRNTIFFSNGGSVVIPQKSNINLTGVNIAGVSFLQKLYVLYILASAIIYQSVVILIKISVVKYGYSYWKILVI